MRVVNAGVVGCGWFGRAHVRAYRAIPGVRLVSVADIDQNVARDVAEEYGANPYPSAEEMVEKEDLDLVSVVVTPQHLSNVGISMAEAGVNLVLEKPLATSREEWDRLQSAVSRHGIIFIPGFIELFNPGYQALRAMVNDGEIGELLTMSSRRIGRIPKRELKWHVGVTLDLGIHEVYAQAALMESRPEVIYAFMSHAMGNESEDISLLILRFKRGVTGIIESNWLTPLGIRSIRVAGSTGSARLDYITQNLILDLKDESKLKHVRWREPLVAELEYAIDHTRSGERPEIGDHFAGEILDCVFDGIERAKEMP